MKVIAGCGCPSIDRKVVNSGKRLRAYVGIDEVNVCILLIALALSFFSEVTRAWNLLHQSWNNLLSRCVALAT